MTRLYLPIVWQVACIDRAGPQHDPTTIFGDSAAPTQTFDTEVTADTGPGTPTTCPSSPCANDLADGRFSDARSPGWLGLSLLRFGNQLLVGAPDLFTITTLPPSVFAVDPLDLTGAEVVHGEDWDDSTGLVVATGPTSGLYVTAPFLLTSSVGGEVYRLADLPVGDPWIREAAELTIRGRPYEWIGMGVAELSFDTGPVLVVSGFGEYNLADGVVRGYDLALIGAVGPEDAAWQITGDPGFGGPIVGWDGDADGVDELITPAGLDTVARFVHPDLALTEGDADSVWTTTGVEPQLTPLGDVGDVTGDGAADLALGDRRAWPSDAAPRAGAVYLVAGGQADSAPTDDLLGWRDGEIGDGWGVAAIGADLDGDGQQDLVAGADGLVPMATRPGQIAVWLGPVSTLDLDQADAVVYGSEEGARFGAALAAFDADADGRDDLYVGSPGEDGYLGAVYRFAGLVP